MGAAETFGRYELIKLVGSGGMALVHLARQRGPEGFVKPCVLKRIAPEALRHDAVRRMFIEEARISALLNHPNIVQTFDYGSVDGVPYMALELIDGVNLAQFCRTLAKKKRWLPVAPAVDICLKLLDALQYAHEIVDLDGHPLRIVHRDVSPQNTLLSRQGVVKLADFGIARHEAREMHTQVGDTAKGKPGYMAPEQAMGDAVDGRADLFSVGVLLTELISARRVMSNSRRPLGVLGIADRIRDLFAYRPEAPAELERVAQRLCALDPNHRPATAVQASAELRAAMTDHARGRPGAPTAQPLEQFLKQVFEQHMPGDTLGAALHQGASSSLPPPSAVATSRPNAPTGAEDPTHGQLPSSPSEPAEVGENEVRTAWARPETRPPTQSTTGHVYEGGWPKEFLPEAEPKLELVSRSSTMEAMQYFGAEESEAVKRRDAGESDAPSPSPAVPNQAQRLNPLGSDPLSDPELSRALDGLRTPPPGYPTSAKGSATATGSIKRRRRKTEIPPVVPLAAVGLAVVVGGILLTSLVSQDEAPASATIEARSGQLTVTSDPPNARIYIDRTDTGQATPKTLTDLPIDQPMLVSVRLRGHKSIPRDLNLRIPFSTAQTSAHFKLKPGRSFTVTSKPEGAVVTINGERMADVTPIVLETIPFGETATVTLEHEGYLPAQLLLVADEESPSEADATLEEAAMLEVLSEPPGADVYVDGDRRGRTPMYDLLVPKNRRYRVTIKKAGFKRWMRRVKRGRTEPLIAKLAYLPFLKMPMSRDERTKARALQRAVSRLQSDVRKLRAQLRRAQNRLERLEARSSTLIGPIAEAQRNVDLVRDELMRREEALDEAKSKREVFRDQVLLRAEMEN